MSEKDALRTYRNRMMTLQFAVVGLVAFIGLMLVDPMAQVFQDAAALLLAGVMILACVGAAYNNWWST